MWFRSVFWNIKHVKLSMYFRSAWRRAVIIAVAQFEIYYRLLGRKVPLTSRSRFEHGLELLEMLVKPMSGTRPTYFERGVKVCVFLSVHLNLELCWNERKKVVHHSAQRNCVKFSVNLVFLGSNSKLCPKRTRKSTFIFLILLTLKFLSYRLKKLKIEL